MATFVERNVNTDQLIQAVSHLTGQQGEHISTIPQLSFHQRMRPTDSTHCIYNLGIGMILQGQRSCRSPFD